MIQNYLTKNNITKQKAHNYLLNISIKFDPKYEYDIFLSHKYSDVDEIYFVIKLLEKNYRVYIDWVEDPQTDRQNVTLETAKLLKERMNSCKSLIFVDSTNSIESKWTPWELGYFDAKKEKVAIFPVLDNEPIYRGREYMKLYPYIVQVNNILYLHDPPILLKDWIEVSTNE